MPLNKYEIEIRSVTTSTIIVEAESSDEARRSAKRYTADDFSGRTHSDVDVTTAKPSAEVKFRVGNDGSLIDIDEARAADAAKEEAAREEASREESCRFEDIADPRLRAAALENAAAIMFNEGETRLARDLRAEAAIEATRADRIAGKIPL